MIDETLLSNLRTAYNQKVHERECMPLEPWKAEERARFLTLLQQEGKQTLLEIGAGAGRDSLFFQAQGLTVTAIDLSPEMVKHCQAKGLNAQVMDVANLAFPAASFHAVYALNCLLHVPKRELPAILSKIRDLLQPDGLFFLGQYGGVDQEGVWEQDHYRPKRFYARYTDTQIQAMVVPLFELVSFRPVAITDGKGHFQSLILRKP